MTEADITINGVRLTNAQAMTVRVALEGFAFDLAVEGCLGTDEHGVFMREAYRKRIDEIRPAMYANNQAYVR